MYGCPRLSLLGYRDSDLLKELKFQCLMKMAVLGFCLLFMIIIYSGEKYTPVVVCGSGSCDGVVDENCDGDSVDD